MRKLKNYTTPFDLESIFDTFLDLGKYSSEDLYKPIEYFNHDKSTNPVNLFSNDNEYIVEVSAPGFNKEELKVELKNNVLSISGEHKSETNESNNKCTRKEFYKKSFSRSFTVPDNISEEIDASFENGILNIVIKKKELPPIEEPKRISIK